MKTRQIAAVISTAATLLTAAPVAAQDNETDFYLTYKDSAGFNVGTQIVPAVVSDEQGNLILDFDQLVLPEGFVFNEEWQTYSTVPGENIGIEFAVAAEDPVLEQAYAAQGHHPIMTTALTLNYYLEDGTLEKTKTFLYEQRAGSAGAFEVPLYLDQDYVISAPYGYELTDLPASSYTVQLNSRNTEDLYLYIEPIQTDPADEADEHEEEEVTSIRLSFYDPSNELIAFQTIPYYGSGEVRLEQNNLDLPEGYELNQPWQEYYSSAGMDLSAKISIRKQDGSDAGNRTRLPAEDNSGNVSASSSVWPGTRRADSVNTASASRAGMLLWMVADRCLEIGTSSLQAL